jgi:hypothetical protein
MSKVRLYIINVLVAFEQFIVALLGFDPDETISSLTGKHLPGSWLEKTINAIFFWQDNHCQKYREDDEGKDNVWNIEIK